MDGDAVAETATDAGFLMNVVSSPLNLVLIGISIYLLYKIARGDREGDDLPEEEPGLPPLKKQDMHVNQLREYDGVKNERILIAVNAKIFDVTNRGKDFYGPGAAYSVFAGRDASRGLSQFRLDPEVLKDEFDDLSDLQPMEMDSVREWEMQFTEKYDYVGKLLKPGEVPTDYSEDDDTENEKNKDD